MYGNELVVTAHGQRKVVSRAGTTLFVQLLDGQWYDLTMDGITCEAAVLSALI